MTRDVYEVLKRIPKVLTFICTDPNFVILYKQKNADCVREHSVRENIWT
jgi:hypothetical protein